jgi:hypothetical protein
VSISTTRPRTGCWLAFSGKITVCVQPDARWSGTDHRGAVAGLPAGRRRRPRAGPGARRR